MQWPTWDRQRVALKPHSRLSRHLGHELARTLSPRCALPVGSLPHSLIPEVPKRVPCWPFVDWDGLGRGATDAHARPFDPVQSATSARRSMPDGRHKRTRPWPERTTHLLHGEPRANRTSSQTSWRRFTRCRSTMLTGPPPPASSTRPSAPLSSPVFVTAGSAAKTSSGPSSRTTVCATNVCHACRSSWTVA